MEEVRTRTIGRLEGDAANAALLVPGGIHPTSIRPGRGPGSTPQAFEQDASGIAHLRPALSIIGPNEVDPPDGPLEGSPRLRNGFIRLFVYVPHTPAGRGMLDGIDDWVMARLDGWQTTLDNGHGLTLTALELSEALPSDEIEGALVRFRRLVAEYLR